MAPLSYRLIPRSFAFERSELGVDVALDTHSTSLPR